MPRRVSSRSVGPATKEKTNELRTDNEILRSDSEYVVWRRKPSQEEKKDEEEEVTMTTNNQQK